MNSQRRWFIALVIAATLSAVSSNSAARPAGFFSISVVDGRNTLITPDGRAFFSLGLNHINVCRQPPYAGVAAFRSAGTLAEKVLADLAYWNMNTGGYDCPPEIQRRLPFFEAVNFLNNGHYRAPGEFAFDDVFENSFAEDVRAKIAAAGEKHRDNPFLIGYYWTDTPRWDPTISRRRHGTDWVSALRALGPDAAGKRRYVAFLRDRYHADVGSFNRAYGLNFASFDSLPAARFDHIDISTPPIVADDLAFLELIAEHLYSIIASAFREHDPNHLQLGEKYLAGDHPKGVLKIAAKYVDAISIQPGPEKGPGPGPGREETVFNRARFDRIHEITGKPLIICDHQTSFFTEANPVTLWHQHATQQEAGATHAAFLEACVATPYIIGYQRCQYIDFVDHRRGFLKQGLLDASGARHEPLGSLIRQTNRNALHSVRTRE